MYNKNLVISFSVILTMVFSISFVSAVDIKLENYYPMPVEAGDYFDINLKIINKGSATSDVTVKFDPMYPFSLDPGDEGEIIIKDFEPTQSTVIKFRIRTDTGAKEGDSFLSFSYKDCIGCVWEKTGRSFPITIMEALTEFDVVLQELSSDKVIIGIANIGKNPANAVTIRIPEQEQFKTTLISSSIVGNLESGDYTLVGFQIVPKSEDSLSSGKKELLVQVDYTDPLGVRRTTSKSISLDSKLLTQVKSENTVEGQKQNFYNDIWFWVSVILFVFMMGNMFYIKLKGKRRF